LSLCPSALQSVKQGVKQIKLNPRNLSHIVTGTEIVQDSNSVKSQQYSDPVEQFKTGNVPESQI